MYGRTYAMEETKNRRYGSSSGEMAFSPGLGDRGIEIASSVTGGG